jgi:hypothetical protein
MHSCAALVTKDYLKGIHRIASDAPQPSIQALAQSTATVPSACPGMLDVLAAYPSLRISSALSCISYAGRHILSCLAPPSYLQALMSNSMRGCSYVGYSYR